MFYLYTFAINSYKSLNWVPFNNFAIMRSLPPERLILFITSVTFDELRLEIKNDRISRFVGLRTHFLHLNKSPIRSDYESIKSISSRKIGSRLEQNFEPGKSVI